MSKKYYVIGGEYADTSCHHIAPGHTEERLGPFPEKEALDVWRGLTGKSVDNALVRYFVRQADDGDHDQWLVVGGEYADTTFQVIAPGKTQEVHGPFSRQEALNKWRELTGKTVDSALTRYDMCTGDELSR